MEVTKNKLPIVMPSNRSGMARRLEDKFPGRLGLLFSPEGKRSPKNLPYALDNGRFSVWSKGKPWNKYLYLEFLEWTKNVPYKPAWAIVPDVVANAEKTFRWWNVWSHIVKFDYEMTTALAVQDGMTPDHVWKLQVQPDVIFIGGTTEWKWATLRMWTKHFPRVHVGRVNTEQLLWKAHKAGAESTDGSGWYHRKQFDQLVRYLTQTSLGFNRHGRDDFLQ